MICPKCGQTVSDSAKFCYACGSSLKSKEEKTAETGSETLNGWVKNADGVWEKAESQSADGGRWQTAGNHDESYQSSRNEEYTQQAQCNGTSCSFGAAAGYSENPEMHEEPKAFNSLGQWVLNIFLAWLPIAGFVLLLVWSFSSGTNPEKKNWARAMLIWKVIVLVLSFALTALFYSIIMD